MARKELEDRRQVAVALVAEGVGVLAPLEHQALDDDVWGSGRLEGVAMAWWGEAVGSAVNEQDLSAWRIVTELRLGADAPFGGGGDHGHHAKDDVGGRVDLPELLERRRG